MTHIHFMKYALTELVLEISWLFLTLKTQAVGYHTFATPAPYTLDHTIYL